MNDVNNPNLHLLPENATLLERSASVAMIPTPHGQIVRSLWNADTCPEAFLPFLAWALSVDDWDSSWSVSRKRAAIKAAREIHMHKGTISAIRKALSVVGHPDAEVIERADCVKRNGTAKRNGTRRRKGPAGWATIRVILKRPVTLSQAKLIQSAIDQCKRNCVHLVALDFRQAQVRRDGTVKRDGSYTRGIVKT